MLSLSQLKALKEMEEEDTFYETEEDYQRSLRGEYLPKNRENDYEC